MATPSRRRFVSMCGMSGLAIALAGCSSLFAPRGIPDEPLILSRQPIESKGQVTPAPPLVHREPKPPGSDLVSHAQKY